MPELNLGPPPTRSPLPAILIAVAVLAAVAAAVFLLNPRKTADLAVTGTAIYAARVETKATPNDKGNGTNIVGTTGSIDRDLYVVVRLKLTDDLRLPIFVNGETLTLTAPDDSILSAEALPPDQAASTYLTFPDLKAKSTTAPLPFLAEVAPGGAVEGSVLFHFNGLTEAEWKARKSATLTVKLRNQTAQSAIVPAV